VRTSAKTFVLLLPLILTLSLSAQSFQHPGVLVDRAQLDFLKSQVAAKTEPFYQEFLWAKAGEYGALDYHIQGPPPTGIIDCGSYSRPNNGCSAEDHDAAAAYLQAVLWYITGDRHYAQNAIDILNTYGHNLKGYTNSNAPLQAAWGSSKWPRAAEIIRYTNAGWKPDDIQAFAHMLTAVPLPLIQNGSGANGNWELSMIEATIGIAVFTNDRTLFDHAVAMWHERVPAYFYYQPIDGDHPQPFPRGDDRTTWNGQTVFNASLNGVTQETCRDFGHTEYGIAATMNAAATAYIQGIDLFQAEKDRLAAALEFNSLYELGAQPPTDLCGGKLHLSQLHATYVLGYNALHNRLGLPLPHTLDFITKEVLTNPLPLDSGHMQVFEPLTHFSSPPLASKQPAHRTHP
jgi:Alginate lyase